MKENVNMIYALSGMLLGNNRSLNSFDGNKKVKGIKRHVIVDKNGFLLAIMVSVAHIHDSKAVLLLMRVLKEFLCSIRVIVADGGYRGEIAEQVKKGLAMLFRWLCVLMIRKQDSNPLIKDG